MVPLGRAGQLSFLHSYLCQFSNLTSLMSLFEVQSIPLKKKVSPRILATASKLVLQRSIEGLKG